MDNDITGTKRPRSMNQALPASTGSFSFGFGDSDDEEGNTSNNDDMTDDNTSRNAEVDYEQLNDIKRPNHGAGDAEKKLHASLLDKYPLVEGFTTLPYKFAIVRDTIYSMHGVVIPSGSIVIVHWLFSGFYEFVVYPLYLRESPPQQQNDKQQEQQLKQCNILNLNTSISEKDCYIPNLTTNKNSITIPLQNNDDNGYLILPPIAIQSSNLTFIAPQQVQSVKCDLYVNRNNDYIFELFPFLQHMPYPTTKCTAAYLKAINKTLQYPQHFTAAPLTVDTTLSSWCWPIDQDYFKTAIFNNKCCVIHLGGQRLGNIKKDFQDFNVKNLLNNSSNSIIWMKSLPTQQPNLILGEQYGERKMNYIQSAPEISYSAYLAGHTIYFNPSDHIQAKYVKSLALQLGLEYGMLPTAQHFNEKEDEMAHVDEMGSFGGDLEIFAVNTKHTTDWHLDAQDNISIQLVGTKKWSVIRGLDQPITNYHPKSTNKASVCADKHMHQTMSTTYTGNNLAGNNAKEYSNQEQNSFNWSNFDNHINKEEFIVRPGSIFYHPAGTYHRVDALDDDGSLSINISLDCLRYSELLLQQLNKLVLTHPILRQRVTTANGGLQNVLSTLENAVGNILPHILQQIKPQQFLIPAISTTAQQIHDYPIATIQYNPTNPLYTPITALIHKDNGCVNFNKQILTNNTVLQSTPDLRAKLKLNKYVPFYYDHYNIDQDMLLDFASFNDNNNEMTKLFTQIKLQYNTFAHLITNEPGYILPPLVAATNATVQSVVTMKTNNHNMLMTLNDYQKQIVNNIITQITKVHSDNTNNNTTDRLPLDLSTLQFLFEKKRQLATFHLYSICIGMASLTTTSAISSNHANATKVPPAYSIGIVVDSAKLTQNYQLVIEQVKNTEETNNEGQVDNNDNNTEQQINTTFNYFKNIALFINYLIVQRVEFGNIKNVIELCLNHILELSICTQPFAVDHPELINVIKQDKIVRYNIIVFILNLFALYTHCGLFVEKP